jgi:hypothetical protein
MQFKQEPHTRFPGDLPAVSVPFDADFRAEACGLTTRRTPLGATTGRSQASALKGLAKGTPRFVSQSQASELAGLVCPQGCVPTKSALSPAGGPVALSRQADTASREDHEFCNPRQTPSERKQRRRFVYDLRDGLRSLSTRRVAACGRKRIALEVEVVRTLVTRDGGGTSQRAHFRGVQRCGSVWECPVCALRIRATRAAELKSAVEAWGPGNVAMLSLTVRHGLGDDLRAVRQGVANSFRRLINGEPWKRFCTKFGLEHHVRSLEVTHGAHGWHPHLHVLFFLEVKLTEDEQARASAWLQNRWAKSVGRELGGDFVPNAHGVDLRESKRADYLAKFSFELTDPGTKRARGKNRTPLQIAASAATGKNQDDEALWFAYCSGMRGAQMLRWSKNLREAVDLGEEPTDQAVVDSEEQQPAEPVAIIASWVWDAIRHRPGMACAILEAAELAASQAEGFAAIQDLIRLRSGPERLRRTSG